MEGAEGCMGKFMGRTFGVRKMKGRGKGVTIGI